MALNSPYLWKQGQGSNPLIAVMGITHHGRSAAVNRVVRDFGSEESFGRAAPQFSEQPPYRLSASPAADRVANDVAQEAQGDGEKRVIQACEGRTIPAPDSTRPAVKTRVVELDGSDIRSAELQPRPGTNETAPIRKFPTKTKEIGWKEGRLGLARPLESQEKRSLGKMVSSPEVVAQLGAAAVLAGMTADTQGVGVADGGNGLKET